MNINGPDQKIYTLKPLKKGPKFPDDNTFITFHVCFGIKFGLRSKQLMVTGGDITGASD